MTSGLLDAKVECLHSTVLQVAWLPHQSTCTVQYYRIAVYSRPHIVMGPMNTDDLLDISLSWCDYKYIHSDVVANGQY